MEKAKQGAVSKLSDPKALRVLFWVCWAVYFLSYVGRLNYAAVMVEVGAAEGYTKSQLGLVSTLMFFCYGGGQLFSGIIGDHVSPRLLVLIGVMGSSACNLLVGLSGSFQSLAVIWGCNGVFQALIWSPMVRIFTMYMPVNYLYRSCVNIQSSCAAGTCFTYLYGSALVGASGWKMVFFTTCGMLLVAGIIWEIFIRKTERLSKAGARLEDDTVEEAQRPAGKLKMKDFMLTSGMLLFIASVISMGILKEGIMTWVPGYVTDCFHVDSSFAIFVTALLPLVNLSGAYAGSFLHKKTGSEPLASAVLFGAAVLSLGSLILFGQQSLVLTLILFSLVTSCMIGINTALISFVPTFFARFNRTSLAVGVLNSMAYVGSAISGYGIGMIAERSGWGAAQGIWLVIGCLGAGCCLLVTPIWKRFKKG